MGGHDHKYGADHHHHVHGHDHKYGDGHGHHHHHHSDHVHPPGHDLDHFVPDAHHIKPPHTHYPHRTVCKLVCEKGYVSSTCTYEYYCDDFKWPSWGPHPQPALCILETTQNKCDKTYEFHGDKSNVYYTKPYVKPTGYPKPNKPYHSHDHGHNHYGGHGHNHYGGHKHKGYKKKDKKNKGYKKKNKHAHKHKWRTEDFDGDVEAMKAAKKKAKKAWKEEKLRSAGLEANT